MRSRELSFSLVALLCFSSHKHGKKNKRRKAGRQTQVFYQTVGHLTTRTKEKGWVGIDTPQGSFRHRGITICARIVESEGQ